MSENKKLNIEEIAVKDYEQKSAQREKERKYYEDKLQQTGLKTLDRFLRYCPNPSDYMKNRITYAHRDLENVAESIAEGKPWAVISGLNPSSPLHLGHKAIFDELLWMQENGAEIYIPLTNDESYVVGKSSSLAESRRMAYDSIIPSIIAMGFNSSKTHIYVDSDYKEIYNVAMDVSNKLTLNKALKVFGLDNELENENPGTMFYRSAVQVAQILLPQYKEFGGPKPTLVPVGIDQHPYILLARDVAEKKKFIPPSEINLKFLWGLDGKGKMSTSMEGSAIFLTDNPEHAERMLKTAYTGGSPIASFQRENGGIPEICPIHDIRTYHFESDDRVGAACRSGELLCGECKSAAIDQVVEYLEYHQAKLPDARKRIDEFLLKVPVNSILE